MYLDKKTILQHLYVLYVKTDSVNKEKDELYDKIMKKVRGIAPDDMFICEFENKLTQYYVAGEKDGFYGGFDILKRLIK